MNATRRPSRQRPAVTGGCRLTAVTLATLLATSWMAAATAPVAQGQDADADGGMDVRLTVSSFTGVLGPGSIEPSDDEDLDPLDLIDPPTTLRLRVLVENRGEVDLDALRVVTEIHPAATSRSQLRQALDGTLRTDPLEIRDPALLEDDVLSGGQVVGIEESFDASLVDWAADGGVHPVSIAVTRGTEVLDKVVTAVVWVANNPKHPLSTVMVWPLDEAPWRAAGGDYLRGVDRSIRTGERLDTLVRAVERSPEAPLVLAPAVHLLEDLRDRADGFTTLERQDGGNLEARRIEPEEEEARRANDVLQRIREVARSLPYLPVSGTYGSADLSALHASGQAESRELASNAAVIARQRLQNELDRAPNGGVHLLDSGVTPEVLDLLPGDHLLVPYTATLEPSPNADPDLREPLRPVRSPAGRALTVMVADPYLSAELSSPDVSGGPLVAAQRVIAATAMIHLEASSVRDRTLLLLPEPDWDPGLDVAVHLIDGLTEAIWLDLVSPDDAAASGRRSLAPLELAMPAAGVFPSDFATELNTASIELQAARTALPDGESSIGGRASADLEDALTRASSRWLRSENQAAAQSLVRDVRRAVSEAFGEVTVSEASVTLTSDSGQVPVTIQRTRGGPITLQVEVASQGRLVWPEGRRSESFVLEDDGSATVSFATEARSTGTFPVRVRITDPSGRYELERANLSVRSTAISGPALTGISSVVVILLLLGGLRRRRRRPSLDVVDTQNGRTPPPDPRYSA